MLKNIVIVVENIEVSKKFYKELFGLSVVLDMGQNVILTEGLVLQEKQMWQESMDIAVKDKCHNIILYFEERNIDYFLERLEGNSFEVQYVHPLREEGGRKVIRIYDPDNHMIEVREINIA